MNGGGSEAENGGSKAAKIVGAVMGFATFVGCVASMFSAGEETTADRKMMKAPGGGGKQIYRDGFEKNPSAYFRDLRNK